MENPVHMLKSLQPLIFWPYKRVQVQHLCQFHSRFVTHVFQSACEKNEDNLYFSGFLSSNFYNIQDQRYKNDSKLYGEMFTGKTVWHGGILDSRSR